MLKLFCMITGDNYKMVSEDTPKSKQKVALLANALMIPVSIWTINGYLLACNVLGASLGVAIATSIICAIIIFIVERIIIMASSNKQMKILRMTMGIGIAIIGAVALDEVVFKKDIDHQLEINKAIFADRRAKQEEIVFDTLYNMAERKKSIDDGDKSVLDAEQKAFDEMNGKGSGIKGVGKITAQKLAIAAKRESANLLKQKTYDSLIIARSLAVAKARAKAEREYGDGLIIRLEALFQLITSNLGTFLIYVVLTVIMFCFEFIVVLVKSITPETNYERRIRLIEEIGEKRMALLSGKESPYIQSDNFLPNALSAKKSINKKHSLFN